LIFIVWKLYFQYFLLRIFISKKHLLLIWIIEVATILCSLEWLLLDC